MNLYTANIYNRFVSYLRENNVKHVISKIGNAMQIDFVTEDEEHFDELSEIAGVDPTLVKRDGGTWRVTFV